MDISFFYTGSPQSLSFPKSHDDIPCEATNGDSPFEAHTSGNTRQSPEHSQYTLQSPQCPQSPTLSDASGFSDLGRKTDKQWAEQNDGSIPRYDKATGQYLGYFADNCSSSPPCRSDLKYLQPGYDGSTLDPLCSTKAFSLEEKSGRKGEVLRAVATWITMELAQKLQHSSPIAAWKNRVAAAIHSPLSAPPKDVADALLEYASTYNKAVKFLSRMGGDVSNNISPREDL